LNLRKHSFMMVPSNILNLEVSWADMFEGGYPREI
jgi:hypothetical protein